MKMIQQENKHKIIEDVLDARQGLYVHALEVDSAYGLQSSIEQLTEQFTIDGYSTEQIKTFFETIEIYYLGEDEAEENEVFSLDIVDLAIDLCE